MIGSHANAEAVTETKKTAAKTTLRVLLVEDSEVDAHLILTLLRKGGYEPIYQRVQTGGEMKAALEAQKAGKVRYIGFTGHKDPRIHLKMLGKDHPWDTAQMPINVMDAHYRSFQKEVVTVCLQKNVGVIGMKSLGGQFPRGRIPTSTNVSAQECIRYALSLPVASLVVGIISMEDLKQDVAIARGFKPMPDTEKTSLLARVRDEAGDGRHELFKSTQAFDGPHHRRQHNFAVQA